MSAYQFSPFAIPAAVTAAVVMLCAIVIVLTRFSRTSVATVRMGVAAATWQVVCVFMYLAVDARTALICGRRSAAPACPSWRRPSTSSWTASSHRQAPQDQSLEWLGGGRAVWNPHADDRLLLSGVRQYWWGVLSHIHRRCARPVPAVFGGCSRRQLSTSFAPYRTPGARSAIAFRLFTIALGIGWWLPSISAMYGIAIYPFGGRRCWQTA